MNERNKYEFHHTCPRNCFSNCTIISTINNDHLVSITGGKDHPYTKGKLCAKGYSYVERNYHQDRLKQPYYQEVKGSGKFKQITWKKAFEMIVCEILNIEQKYGHFLPLALYKGSGNIGVHHFVTDHFFSSLGETTKIKGSALPSTGFEAIQYDIGAVKMSDPAAIKEASMIIIWGANPSATNIHLIPFIIEAKTKGAKLVVIDPLYSQTAELADLYIQIRPGTDGALANLLLKELFESNQFDKEFVKQHSYGFHEFFAGIKKIDKEDFLFKCGIVEEAFTLLANWIKEAGAISHLIGIGLQKHANGGQNTRAIEALAAIHGDIGKKGGGVFFRRNDARIFKNQQLSEEKKRIIHINEKKWRVLPSHYEIPIEMLWISCANPLVQEPNPQFLRGFLKDIPFVVTTDFFMTPTAKIANLVLPTTTHFEEMDILTNDWHNGINFSEKALRPYGECLSEWEIMNEIAKELKKTTADISSFPIHSSEEDYLNAQFTEEVHKCYFSRDLSDLMKREAPSDSPRTVWENRKFATKTGLYEFYSSDAEENGLPPMPL